MCEFWHILQITGTFHNVYQIWAYVIFTVLFIIHSMTIYCTFNGYIEVICSFILIVFVTSSLLGQNLWDPQVWKGKVRFSWHFVAIPVYHSRAPRQATRQRGCPSRNSTPQGVQRAVNILTLFIALKPRITWLVSLALRVGLVSMAQSHSELW